MHSWVHGGAKHQPSTSQQHLIGQHEQEVRLFVTYVIYELQRRIGIVSVDLIGLLAGTPIESWSIKASSRRTGS